MRKNLTTHGLKATEARLAILEVLSNNSSPQSYEQIKPNLPSSINKTTFYRNMALFEEHGIVSKFESKDRVWFYEFGDGCHAHFMCEKCKKIICLHISTPFLHEKNYIKKVIYQGWCEDCREDK